MLNEEFENAAYPAQRLLSLMLPQNEAIDGSYSRA
jgi:hypothetical protein